MIPITRFGEWCIELMNSVNAKGFVIQGVVMAVKEEHMVKKLRDKSGVWLAVNYPDALGTGTEDNGTDEQSVFFFIVEKTNPGSQTDFEEMIEYGMLQDTMLALRKAIRQSVFTDCVGLTVEEDFKIEWEYQIFGGFNGLSLGCRLTDHTYD